MRTTLTLPDRLVEELCELTGEKRKSRLVTHALTAYATGLRQERLLKLRGHSKLLSDDFDPEALRAEEENEI